MKKLLINAKRIFSSPEYFDADSILINGDVIEAIGRQDDFLHELRWGVSCIDVENHPVFPGFIDAHNHFTYFGLQLFKISLNGIFRKDQIIERLINETRRIPADQPILAYDYEYDIIAADQRLCAADLDLVFPDRMIHINDRTGHISVTNCFTLLQTGLFEDEKAWLTDQGISEFNGEICGKVNSHLDHYFQKQLHTEEKLKTAWKFASEMAVSKGVTGIHGMCMEEDYIFFSKYRSQLPLRFRIYAESKDVEKVYSEGFRQIGGCGEVIVDGDTGPYTAAFLQPYTDRPDCSGVLYYSDAELTDYVTKAHRKGMQVGLHCVGDAASAQLIKALTAAQNTDGKRYRHRIEHLEFANDEIIQRAKSLGLCVVIQPSFNYYWPHNSYVGILGPERADHADMVNTLVRSGLHVGLGSDCPVTPCDPLLTIHAAVNHSNPKERISPGVALHLHTYGSAYCGFEEGFTGSIAPGMKADLTVLEDDPRDSDPESIKDIQVLKTIFSGNLVYTK